MRIINYCIAIAMLGPLYGISQQNPAQLLNLGFEKTDDKNTILGCQFPFGSSDYYSYRDDQVKYDGKNAIRIEKNRNSQTKGSGNVTFRFSPIPNQ